jgi:hypothetical protein
MGRERDREGDEWVLACWHAYFGLDVVAVVEVEGRPRADFHAGSQRRGWYRWKSYHAARAFQRDHPHLEAYIILNLSRILREFQAQCKAYEEWINSQKG